jgi:hypothetical protein
MQLDPSQANVQLLLESILLYAYWETLKIDTPLFAMS